MTRFGVVGIGYGQQVLVPAIRAVPGCQVVALAASTQERAERIAERLGVPAAYGSWEALVSSDQLDAVAIAVPPSAQPEIASAAARAGKHLFCEKPLAASLDGAAQIARAVRDAGVRAVVDFQFRCIPAWAAARQQLDAGVVGAVRHVSILWHVETYANRHRLTSWKTSPDDGGGALAAMGSHVLHYVEWLFGPIATISCQAHGWPGLTGPEAGEPVVTLVLVLASGAPVSVTIGTNSPGGTGHHIEVYGDDGLLLLANPGPDYMAGFTVAVRRRDEPAPTVLWADPVEPGVDGRIPPVVALVTELAAAIEAGRQPAPNVRDGWRAQYLLELARRSSAERAVLDVGSVGLDTGGLDAVDLDAIQRNASQSA